MNMIIVDNEIETLNEIHNYVKTYKQFDHIVTCINSLEALEIVKKNNFDIALLSIEMSGMNGLELAKKFLGYSEDMRIVFITAYNFYATEAFDVNAIDYILKPIKEERFIKALDKLVNKKLNEDNLKIKNNENKLYIQTFGKFIVKLGDNIVNWNRKKAYELFAYLIENIGIPVHKEKLCDILWPYLDLDKALVNLQSTIYTIRKTFREYNIREINIKYSCDNYTLTIKNIYVDLIEFENTLRQGFKSNDINMLKSAIEIYKNNYLEEEDWNWAEFKRMHLRKNYIKALKKIRS